MMRSGEYVERFEREARAAGVLKSRYAVRVLDVAETPKGLPYMVMDFLEGRDLQDEIEQRGALPIEEAVEYLLHACAAMAEAHDLGIVHRDLKPANLFLCFDEGERIVRVLDFGISKQTLQDDPSVTTTATAIGTPLYMSPEQVRSARTVDTRADIWSLGVIAYEMLCGRTPFPGENPTGTIPRPSSPTRFPPCARSVRRCPRSSRASSTTRSRSAPKTATRRCGSSRPRSPRSLGQDRRPASGRLVPAPRCRTLSQPTFLPGPS